MIKIDYKHWRKGLIMREECIQPWIRLDQLMILYTFLFYNFHYIHFRLVYVKSMEYDEFRLDDYVE